MAPKIQHTVIFPLKEDAEGIEKLNAIVEKFNEIPGIQAAFRPAGGPGLTQEELFEKIKEAKGGADRKPPSRPNKGRLEGYNYCLMVIADDIPSLKNYLHGEAHAQWGPNVRPLFKEDSKPIVFDSDLKLSGVPAGKIQHTVFYKLDEFSAENAAKMQEACESLSKLEGVSASFAPAGCGGRPLADTLAALDWPDKTSGFTHVLTVIADEPRSLLSFFDSDEHKGFYEILKQGDEYPYMCAMDSEWAVTV